MFKKFLSVKFLLVLIILIASFLRLYKLSVNPPSLFGDELDLGYQAYSILKTGKDYQGNFMPIHFHSLAEWRTPLYLYSAVPTVAIFGISPLGVRLPAAIFGILSIYAIYLLSHELTKNKHLSLLCAFLLSVSPWHLQYSRAGFEVTEMLFFLILGLYLFLKSLSNPKLLWVSVFCLVLTPWIYSTAKFFTPFLLVFLVLIYWKEIFAMQKTNLIKAMVVGLIIGLPIALSTLFGGGAQRFNYISIFADPTTESNVGYSREMSARIRGETGAGLSPTLIDRVFSNKFTYWGKGITENYLQAFSTNFLFVKGDPNPRQSVGIGEFYRIEFIALILGIAFFFLGKDVDKRLKLLIAFWVLLAPLPSAMTIDGGNHATRQILLLPPLIFLISYGWVGIYKSITQKYRWVFVVVLSGLYIVSGMFYFREYYTSYPWNSERWWHYGWGPSINEIKSIDSSYDRVIISMKGEPAWIFFAGYYQYDPALWQKDYPIGNDVEVAGFGKVSHTGKFYFGSPEDSIKIYGIGKYIDSKTLYLANANEDGENLILHPDKTPAGLKLIKAIPFPSGEPAFYLFSGI
jgi:4-amino-4-deoxy-L-arabinose transferase-like glycosyltransferase